MKAKEFILKEVKKRGQLTSADVVQRLGISRQTAAQHFRELIFDKKLLKVGSTHKAYYIPYAAKKAAGSIKVFSGVRLLHGLKEDEVFNETSLKMNLKKILSKNSFGIVNYAFTEMLNNAIDHAKAKKVFFNLKCERGVFTFLIEDHGIGVFESIRRKFNLKDHYEAVEHLLKGKQTTAPEKHSGEGIFFTSKISDKFLLSSAQLKLIFDNKDKESFLRKLDRPLKGTKVQFELNPKSRKSLKELFDAYSNEDYEFDKTKVTVHIAKKEGDYVSRSEAKRILFGLDKFKRIEFDFKHVKGIGQSFADEIFRVYQQQHPHVALSISNANSAIQFMIQRAQKNLTIKIDQTLQSTLQ